MHDLIKEDPMRVITLLSVLFSSHVMAQTVDHLFIPNGFDNNDNVELVVTGKFPNPCYTHNKVEVDVKNDSIYIEVTSLSNQAKSLCEDMKIPFSETVSIGNLQAGDYNVFVNQGSRNELRGKLDVAVSGSSSVDDHFYAQVDYVELGFTGGLSGDAVLVGSSVSPCLKLDHVEYISNKNDTLSILPIMKKVSQDCPEKRSRLSIPVKFDPRKLNAQKILLFVRSIDGKSVHAFVDKN
jgi:hypothetical protein